jgi:hypothetical protein
MKALLKNQEEVRTHWRSFGHHTLTFEPTTFSSNSSISDPCHNYHLLGNNPKEQVSRPK